MTRREQRNIIGEERSREEVEEEINARQRKKIRRNYYLNFKMVNSQRKTKYLRIFAKSNVPADKTNRTRNLS